MDFSHNRSGTALKALRADNGLKSALCEFINDSDQVIEVSRPIVYLASEIRSRLDHEQGKKWRC
jgi:hypothetical protein